MTGTFARVCLVRPASGTEEEREKVFALKILRKAEVIKLKQIDHVRHERQILGDVAGYPFITELIASFSDHEFLYLLVREKEQKTAHPCSPIARFISFHFFY